MGRKKGSKNEVSVKDNGTTKIVTEVERSEIVKELSSVVNRYSLENISNTPDFILAEYLMVCLENFNKISNDRENWYGKHLSINGGDK